MADIKHLLVKPQFFLLNVGPSLYSEYLLKLMKQQIAQIPAADEQLQAFVTWISQQPPTVRTRYRSVVLRAFYFDLALARALDLVGSNFELARALERTITCNLDPPLALDLALDRVLGLEQVIPLCLQPQLVVERVLERAAARARSFEPRLERAVQQLKARIPELGKDEERFKQWWSTDGRTWIEQIRAALIEYRNLGHKWQFSYQQQEVLKQYHSANQLLIHHLNSDCYMTGAVRLEIESTLLLPAEKV